jgi:hypothetical protein
MRQVIDPQAWRRRPAGAANAGELSLSWRAQQVFWAEPILLSSLTVWRAAAVMWAGLVLAAAGEAGFPQAGRCAPAPARATNFPFGSRS